jgi:hypothetical protein
MIELDALKQHARAAVTEAKARRAAGLEIKTRRRPSEQAEVERLEADTRGIKKMMAVLDHMGTRAPRWGTVTLQSGTNTPGERELATTPPRACSKEGRRESGGHDDRLRRQARGLSVRASAGSEAPRRARRANARAGSRRSPARACAGSGSARSSRQPAADGSDGRRQYSNREAGPRPRGQAHQRRPRCRTDRGRTRGS